jgi:toxin ParE1/3/4
MMRLHWLDDAWADLQAIVDYHADLHVDAQAIVRMVDNIHRNAERLRDFPLSGRSGRVEGTRELPLVRIPYVLIYKVEDDVVILRVLHSAMNWPPRTTSK